MAWSDIAESAYKAYAASTGNKNFQGNPMPEWSALPDTIRNAWEAAARQAGYCIENKSALGESGWSGWVSPSIRRERAVRGGQ